MRTQPHPSNSTTTTASRHARRHTHQALPEGTISKGYELTMNTTLKRLRGAVRPADTTTQLQSEWNVAGHAVARNESPPRRVPGARPGPRGTRLIWDHSVPFPPDPNAPSFPSDRLSRPRLASEASTPAAHIPDALERELAQLRLIGPAAGAELCRIVYGAGERGTSSRGAVACSPLVTRFLSGQAVTRPRCR